MPDYIPDDLIGSHCEIVATLFQPTVLIFVADVDKMWRSDLSLGFSKIVFAKSWHPPGRGVSVFARSILGAPRSEQRRLELHRHHVSITLHCSRYESSPSSIKPSTTNPISPQPPSFSRGRSVGNWTHRGHSLQQCVHTAFIEAPEPAWETALSFWHSQWNPQRRYDHLRPLHRPRKGRHRRDTHIRSGMHPGSFSHPHTAIPSKSIPTQFHR